VQLQRLRARACFGSTEEPFVGESAKRVSRRRESAAMARLSSSADFEKKKVTLSRFDGLTVAVGSTRRYTSIETRNQFSSSPRRGILTFASRERERGRDGIYTCKKFSPARHYLRPPHSRLLFAEHGNLKRSPQLGISMSDAQSFFNCRWIGLGRFCSRNLSYELEINLRVNLTIKLPEQKKLVGRDVK